MMTHSRVNGRLRAGVRFAILVVAACVSALTGSARAQQDIGQVSWSPDGKYLAFYATWHGDSEIYIYDAAEKSLIQLTANDAKDSTPSFTLDGKSVLYASDIGGDQDVYIVDLKGENPRRLFGQKGIHEFLPRETAGGRFLFSTRAVDDPADMDIHLWDPETGGRKTLVDGSTMDAWATTSSDGSKLLFTSNRTGRNEIYLADHDGANLRQLTQNALGDGFGSGMASFAPDGGTFIYWSDDGDEGPMHFRIKWYDLETGSGEALPRHVRYTALPAISPDGAQIAYAAATEEDGLDGPWSLYIMNSDGSENQKVFPWSF